VTPQLDPGLQAEFNGPIGLGPVIGVDTTRIVDAPTVAKAVMSALDGLRSSKIV
jgi:hypothetical protein